jgi:DNA repair protein RecO (recombination protein O)
MATSEAAAPAEAPRARTRGSRGHAANPALQAYVLHGWDWSESSLIVDLYTRTQGRLVAAARGAKKPTSHFRPVLLPFHALTVWLSRPNADANDEVHALRAVEWAGSAPLPNSALMSGFYLNELLMRGLARQDPHPVLYDAYADTLATLAAPERASADEGAALRAFELMLLRELGLLPDLSQSTLVAEPVQSGRRYGLQPEAGLAPEVGSVAGARWVAIEAALAHGSMDALRHACRPVGAALRTMLRTLVHYHLGTAQLRTRQVGLELQRLAEAPSR